jgi:enoyl-CoA hydratase/carnithine racemase
VSYETIIYEVDDRIASITFNRPDQLNAVSPLMARELRRAYAAAEADESVWITIVTGAGRAFCAGADVAECYTKSRISRPIPSGRLPKRRHPLSVL